MSRYSGQALVELAVTLPVLLLLALGGAALARLADARAGLDAATAASVAEAARAQDPEAARSVAAMRFAALVAGYPIDEAALSLDLGDFRRGSIASAVGTARVSLAFAPVPGLPRQAVLHSTARAVLEPWRSRVAPPRPRGRSGCGLGCPGGG